MDKFNLDGHKMKYHPEEVAAFFRGDDVKPVYVEISPTAFCNHRCVFCHYNHLGHSGRFQDGRISSIVKEIADIGAKSLVFAGIGEPLLNKETVPAIKYAKELGLDVAMSTNGALLKEADMTDIAKSLTWIRFSFNASDASGYAKIHQTKESDFELVLSNMAKLVDAKKSVGSEVTIGVQYVVLPETESGIEELGERLKEIGVDYFVIKHFYEHDESDFSKESKLISDERLAELQAFAGELSSDSFAMIVRNRDNLSKERVYNKCYGLPFIVYIRENGEVYTCFSYQSDERTSLGNLNEKSLAEIWSSEGKRNALDYINNCIDKNSCQPACRHHQLNNYLWDLKNPSMSHINFI